MQNCQHETNQHAIISKCQNAQHLKILKIPKRQHIRMPSPEQFRRKLFSQGRVFSVLTSSILFSICTVAFCCSNRSLISFGLFCAPFYWSRQPIFDTTFYFEQRAGQYATWGEHLFCQRVLRGFLASRLQLHMAASGQQMLLRIAAIMRDTVVH